MIIHSATELAIYLKNQRKKLKLTQKQVGDLVGLQQKSISAIENNPENIRLSTLFRILSALETEVRTQPKQQPASNNTQWSDEW